MLPVTTINNVICDLIKLYEPNFDSEIIIVEDFEQLTAKASFKLENSPNDSEIRQCMSFPYDENDKIFWSLSYCGDKVLSYELMNPIYEAINFDIYKYSDIELVFSIQKNIVSSRIPIYSVEAFTDFLEMLDLKTMLSLFGRFFDSYLTFECLLDSIDFQTDTIAFANSKNIDFNILETRQNKVVNRQLNSIWSSFDSSLFPSDFKVLISDNERLKILFDKMVVLLSAMSVCDYTEFVDKSVNIKLNGYKSQIGTFCSNNLKSMPVDIVSRDMWSEITSWSYNGGSVVDKLNIARNIISLNCDFSTLSLNQSTFSSILSNYKIFERENVRDYIELRNSVSELLIDIHAKSNELVDAYSSQFKQNLLAILSFLTTVVILNVITNGDFKSCFTTPILWIILVFLAISTGLMIYFEWEVKQRVEKHFILYEQVKNRYKDLFSLEELNEIFKESSHDNEHSNVCFVKQQIKLYTTVWKYSLLTIFIFVFFMWIYNCWTL